MNGNYRCFEAQAAVRADVGRLAAWLAAEARGNMLFFTPGQAEINHVIRNLRADDARELRAIFGPDLRGVAPHTFAAATAAAWWAAALIDRETQLPAAIVGVTPAHPTGACRSGGAWLAGTAAFTTARALALGVFVRDALIPYLRAEEGLTRVEVRALAANARSIRWLEWMGASRECEIPGHGVNGEAFVQLAWS